MAELPVKESAIDKFIASFEKGTLPKERWTHSAHLMTGACYVHTLGISAATYRMRLCVGRYNEAVGGKNTETSGYHETITVAWIKLIGRLLHDVQPIGRAGFARPAVAHCVTQRDIFSHYYDFDVAGSIRARREWVSPTLQPLD